MQKFYFDRYNIISKKSWVFPTVVNDKYFYKNQKLREKFRKKLSIDDYFVYIYVGGTDYWQNLDKIIHRYYVESKRVKNLFFLIITTNPDEVYKILESLEIKNLERIKITIFKCWYNNKK